MTEDEAKTKWCPFARLVTGEADGQGGLVNVVPVACNRFSIDGALHAPTASFCIASACMAWRHDLPTGRAETRSADGAILNRGEPYANQGHCGLAGSA